MKKIIFISCVVVCSLLISFLYNSREANPACLNISDLSSCQTCSCGGAECWSYKTWSSWTPDKDCWGGGNVDRVAAIVTCTQMCTPAGWRTIDQKAFAPPYTGPYTFYASNYHYTP